MLTVSYYDWLVLKWSFECGSAMKTLAIQVGVIEAVAPSAKPDASLVVARCTHQQQIDSSPFHIDILVVVNCSGQMESVLKKMVGCPFQLKAEILVRGLRFRECRFLSAEGGKGPDHRDFRD